MFVHNLKMVTNKDIQVVGICEGMSVASVGVEVDGPCVYIDSHIVKSLHKLQ